MADCRWISFHGLFALYSEEIELVRSQGHEELVNRLQS